MLGKMHYTKIMQPLVAKSLEVEPFRKKTVITSCLERGVR